MNNMKQIQKKLSELEPEQPINLEWENFWNTKRNQIDLILSHVMTGDNAPEIYRYSLNKLKKCKYAPVYTGYTDNGNQYSYCDTLYVAIPDGSRYEDYFIIFAAFRIDEISQVDVQGAPSNIVIRLHVP